MFFVLGCLFSLSGERCFVVPFFVVLFFGVGAPFFLLVRVPFFVGFVLGRQSFLVFLFNLGLFCLLFVGACSFWLAFLGLFFWYSFLGRTSGSGFALGFQWLWGCAVGK